MKKEKYLVASEVIMFLINVMQFHKLTKNFFE